MFEEEEIDGTDDSTVDDNDLDQLDDESEDIEDEPLDDDPEGDSPEDEEAPDSKDEAQIARVLATLEGKDLKEIAKQLLHTQRLASHKAQEAKANQVAADAVLERLERIEQNYTRQPKEEADLPDEEFPAFPKNERGVPIPPKGYWVEEFYPMALNHYKALYLREHDEGTAVEMAKIAAREKVDEEKARYREYAESLTTTKTKEFESSEESRIKSKASEQQKVMDSEQDVIRGLAGRLGYDPEKTAAGVLDLAKSMVAEAYKAGKLTAAQVVEPELARSAINQAWTYVQRNPEIFDDKFAVGDKPTTRSTPGSSSGGSGVRSKTQTSSMKYPERHLRFCSSIGADPKEYADKYGVLK